MLIPDLELIIERAADGATTAGLRVELPSRRVELAERVPISITDATLRTLEADPDAYGAALTAMLFAPALREAWQRARGFAEGAGQALRVRLDLGGDDALHAIRWELLHDPIDQSPLAYSERVRLSRFLGSASLADIQLAERPELRALVAVASPPTLGQGMAAVHVADEVARARRGLGEIAVRVLAGDDGPASLPAIAAALRDGAHLLYLVCHGALVDGQPYLWLEQDGAGPYRPVPGADLVQTIAGLERRPLLVVLASCQGGGDSYQMLTAVGPLLARAGVGAVLAMQGNVPMELVARLIPRLFEELRRDGQIDRALAAARAALPAASEWWMPALWMAVRDGALWRAAPAAAPLVAPAAAVPAAPAFRVPYPPSPLFRGRDAELAELARILAHDGDGPARVIPAISGMAGIGKTQLASEFAHRYRAAFPGGVFWLDMSQPDGVSAQVAELGGPDGLGLPGWAQMSFDDRVAAVRRAWEQSERRLLVLDNLEEPPLLEAWQVLGGGTRELITTRRGVWAATSGVQLLRLPVLARPEGVRLLLAPRYGPQLAQALADPPTAQAAEAICEQVGDLPLALALAGAYLEQVPSLSLAGFRAQLEQKTLDHLDLQGELEADLPTRSTESVAATIALSYARLDGADPADAPALALLACAAQLAPAPIPQRLLARLAGRSPDDEREAARADASLRRLAAVGLIDLLPEGAAVQRLVGAYARARDGAAASMSAAAQALTDEVASLDLLNHPLRGVPYLPHLTAMAGREPELAVGLSAAVQRALGTMLHGQADYAAARQHLERALALSQQLGPDHPDTAISHVGVGRLLIDQGQAAAARAHYERALAIGERAAMPNYALLVDALNGLGDTLQGPDQAAAAQAYYERALAIGEQRLGPRHHAVGTSLNNLALVLQEQGERAAARPYLERALAIAEQVRGPDHLETAITLTNLGNLLQAEGDDAAARPLFERACAIVERQLGPGHPMLAHSLTNLGNLLQAEGDHAAARARYEQALAIRERALGPDHPDTATSLHNLGNLLQTLGDAAAQAYYERALKIYARLGSEFAVDEAITRNNLGNLLQAEGDHQAARPHFERALALREQALGPDHIDTATSLRDLGNLLQAEGDHQAARPLFERALAIRERTLDPHHLDIAFTLVNLGHVHYAEGDYAAARPLFERALKIYTRLGRAFILDEATTRHDLGNLLRDDGDYAAARTHFKRALAIREQELGPDHQDTADTLNDFGNLFYAEEDYAAARPLYERALKIYTRLGKAFVLDEATMRNNLGNLLYAEGDYAPARAHFKRALAIREQELDPDHLDIADTLSSMGSLLRDDGDEGAARPLFERALAIYEQVLGDEDEQTIQARENLDALDGA